MSLYRCPLFHQYTDISPGLENATNRQCGIPRNFEINSRKTNHAMFIFIKRYPKTPLHDET